MQDSKQVYWHLGIFNDECIAYDPLEPIKASTSNVSQNYIYFLLKYLLTNHQVPYYWNGTEDHGSHGSGHIRLSEGSNVHSQQ